MQTFIIDTVEAWEDLKAYAGGDEFDVLTLDVETDSEIEKTANLYGVGICVQPNQAFYIPIRYQNGNQWWTQEQEEDIAMTIYSWAQTKKLIGHNIIFDVLVLENNWGLDLSELIYSDTILQKHTLNEERPFALKEVAVQYLGPWADKAQAALKENVLVNGGRWTKDKKDMYKADTHVLAEYCCWDVMLCRFLFDIFEPQIIKDFNKLFYEEEVMPLYREVTIPMKRNGFPVDVNYFEKLNSSITVDIGKLHLQIMNTIEPEVRAFVEQMLNKEFPVKQSGNFPKAAAAHLGITLPTNKKTGKTTISKAHITKLWKQVDQSGDEYAYYDWLLKNRNIEEVFTAETITEIQVKMFFAKYPEDEYIFNLGSNDHLGWIFFQKYGMKPLSKTEGGKPQCDDYFLQTSAVKEHEWVKLLIDYKKLNKLKSTYIEGILERHIDGILYTSMLQFGTTSGRYASRNPNLQNQPRTKDEESDLSPLVLSYTNAIKKGFVAPKGYKIVNADYASLEPVCFAHVSNEPKLREVFKKGYDLYSSIAIDSFGVKGCSADKKADNYLKNVHPELRQQAKIFCLAVVYGASPSRIADEMGISFQEAKAIIDNYLDAYPNLKKYMYTQDFKAMKTGQVASEFGRIRHLLKAKLLTDKHGKDLLKKKWADEHNLGEERYKLKNQLNNAKNMPIQGLAAHIVNRAMIATARAFKANNINGYLALSIHDELSCIIDESQTKLAAHLLKDCMENTTKISVPLSTEPVIADCWGDAK